MRGPDRPTHIPSSYRFHHRVEGRAAATLGRTDGQIEFVFTRDETPRELTHPLIVAIAPSPDAVVAGTENRDGERVVLANGLPGTYHDGWWSVGPGDHEITQGGVTLHWQRSVHSLLVATPAGTVGVRGTQDSGIDKLELARIAASCFPAA